MFLVEVGSGRTSGRDCVSVQGDREPVATRISDFALLVAMLRSEHCAGSRPVDAHVHVDVEGSLGPWAAVRGRCLHLHTPDTSY